MKTALALALSLVACPAMAKTISHDSGGRIVEYHRAVEAARASGEAVRIDGLCASACTLYLSLPAPQVCITPRARFGFHSAISPDPKVRDFFNRSLLRAYPSWVRGWVNRNGGLTRREVTMDYRVASRHLRTCGA